MAHLETFHLDSTGARLAIDRSPGDGPPWIFLHGLASTRSGIKGDAILELARKRGRECYRFDFRGHGESTGTLEDTTISQLCEDTRTVLESVQGKATLIGSSLGGLIAAWTAARHPELVAGLVLIAPAFGMLQKLQSARTLVTAAHDRSCTLEVGEHVVADANSYDEDRLPDLLTMPTLAIHGGSDDVVRATSTAMLFERIPHRLKELWVVPEGDHSLHLRMPDVLERIDRFLLG